MFLLVSASYDTAHAKARELSEFFLLQVWPGETVFVDFFHTGAFNYWLNFVSLFHSILPFDGLWIVSWTKIYLLLLFYTVLKMCIFVCLHRHCSFIQLLLFCLGIEWLLQLTCTVLKCFVCTILQGKYLLQGWEGYETSS